MIPLFIFFITLTLFTGCAIILRSPQVGSAMDEKRMNKIKLSDQYLDSKFVNRSPIKTMQSFGSSVSSIFEYVFGSQQRVPEKPLPVHSDVINLKHHQEHHINAITWLGHSTILINLDNKYILTDPIFSKKSSPVSWIGPNQFDMHTQIDTDMLPNIDYVVISHDHYDHLDYDTIRQLKEQVQQFLVPLGVGAHLEHWGVDPTKIVELDWWDEKQIGSLTFAATPSQHFSGRGLTNGNTTLWASWVIKSETTTLFFSGDSGYFDGFKEIGNRFGPFDMTLLESGAYHTAWSKIHMMPEETVQAHLDLKGDVLLPIHWAKFNLSIHDWDEPIHRISKAAIQHHVTLTTPLIGERLSLNAPITQSDWWH